VFLLFIRQSNSELTMTPALLVDLNHRGPSCMNHCEVLFLFNLEYIYIAMIA